MKKIAVLVLAAGESSRMNGIKQLLKIQHKTLLDITLKKVKTLQTSTIFCVLGANAKLIETEIETENIEFIYNLNYKDGLSASIVAGIHHLENSNQSYDGIFIILADQPAISIEYFKAMITLFTKNDTKIIASNYNDKPGVPAIFPKKMIAKLKIIKGDKGAKELMKKNIKDIIFSNLPTNLIDIDTSEDYLNYTKSIL